MTQVQTDIDLLPFNTFRVSAKTSRFFVFRDLDHTDTLKDLGAEVLFLGHGANVLFTKDFRGTVIKNEIVGRRVISDDSKGVTVELGSGENWHDFVMWSVENNLSGVENLALIPGTVGAAAVGNIAAYGQNVGESIVQVAGRYWETGQKASLGYKDCKFYYRDSVFKNELADKFFITMVVFRLSKMPKYDTNYHSRYESLSMFLPQHSAVPYTPKDIAQAVIAIRQVKMPDWTKIGTAGSFFKNPFVSKQKYADLQKEVKELQAYPVDKMLYPNLTDPVFERVDQVKIPAARLLDELGWKGKQIGRVGTFAKHALVVINLGGATGQEILEFTQKMQADVKSHYGIVLEPEVQII